MENVTMNEKAVIIDEQLENVSGGVDPSCILKTYCSLCKKTVSKLEIVNYNNRPVCKTCMEKLNKR